MLKLRFAAPAVADLEHIREWLSREASSSTAVDQLSRIAAGAARLRDFPRIAPIEREVVRRKTVPHSPYLIFYRIEADTVVILRVRHNREDWRPAE